MTVNEPIEEDKPQEELRHEPYSLPPGFTWDTLDLADPLVVSILKKPQKNIVCFQIQIDPIKTCAAHAYSMALSGLGKLVHTADSRILSIHFSSMPDSRH